MKRIYIVRHAKSSWDDLTLGDKQRPLNKRGKRDAPIMAQRISERHKTIDMLCSSSSQRTRETAGHFMGHLTFTKVEYMDKIYHAPSDVLLEVIHDLPPEAETAMILGHNPGSTNLYNHFADEYLDNLPTCGVFMLEIDGEWSDADQQNTSVTYLTYPKSVS